MTTFISNYEQVNAMPEREAILDAAPEGTQDILWNADEAEELTFVLSRPPSAQDIIYIANRLQPNEIILETDTRLKLVWF